MTKEEKARAYDEAIKLAKEILNSGSYDEETIEYVFPELKESEDERIRKELIGLVKEIKAQPLKRLEDYDAYIAWLEKQKPAEWSEEDEDMLILIEGAFSDYLDYVQEDKSLTKHQTIATKDRLCWCCTWLKSLRPRKQWKPSEEQMEALKIARTGKTLDPIERSALDKLFVQLRKHYNNE